MTAYPGTETADSCIARYAPIAFFLLVVHWYSSSMTEFGIVSLTGAEHQGIHPSAHQPTNHV